MPWARSFAASCRGQDQVDAGGVAGGMCLVQVVALLGEDGQLLGGDTGGGVAVEPLLVSRSGWGGGCRGRRRGEADAEGGDHGRDDRARDKTTHDIPPRRVMQVTMPLAGPLG